MGQDSPNLDVARPGHYRFGDVEVDIPAHTLKRAGELQAIEPKAFAVLLALLQRPGELVGHEELLDGVWGHRHVTPGVLTRAIAQLRHALGDDPQHPRYIQTRHALGYSFIGELHGPDAPPAPAEGDASATPTPAEAAGLPAAPAVSVMPAVPVTNPSLEESVPPRRRSLARVGTVAGLLLLLGGVAGLAVVGWDRLRTPARVSSPSIAVLPFTTLTPGQEDRYFAEGLSAEMLSALSELPGLKVAAWRPPEAVDRSKDVKALGRLLGVSTILDANVRRDGERLRINAMLSDATTGYTLWSKVYDGGTGDVFATQSDIAREVATILVGRLPEDGEHLARRLTPTRDVAAFDAYLKGVAMTLQSGGANALEVSASHFREALASDSGFARAQAALCRTELWKFESQRNSSAFELAKAACQKAADMDSSIGDVDIALGDLYRIRGDHTRAARYYGKWRDDPALAAQAHMGLAQVLIDQGQDERAMAEFRFALAARPDDAQVHAELGYQQYRLGRYADAIASYRQVIGLRPDVAAYWATLGGLLVNGGDPVEARWALHRSIELQPNASAYANLAELDFRDGKLVESVRRYGQAIALEPDFFLLHGYLADVLDADARTREDAKAVYADAARLANDFLEKKPDDALATAALGWYMVNLGDQAAGRKMAVRAESLRLEPGEVAFLNAQTFASIGALDDARSRIAQARGLGVSEPRIASSQILQRTGLVDPVPRRAGRG